MPWKKPTQEDLVAVMSAKEVEVYQRSASFGGADPVERIIAGAAGVLRGYLRRGGGRMSPVGGEIPEELLLPCMEYAAYTLLKRMSAPISRERADAATAARTLFERIAERKHTPEPYEGAASGDRPMPIVSNPTATAILG